MSDTRKWGVTQVKVARCTYTWTITNFTYLRKKIGEEIESPCFSIGINNESEWCLRLYSNGINENFKDYLSLYLYRKSSLDHDIDGRYVLSILDEKGEKIIEEMEECQYNKNYSSWGFASFVKRELAKEKLLINNSLTLHCEIAIVTGIVDASSEDINFQSSSRKQSEFSQVLCDHMEKLFLDERFSDVKLIATSCNNQMLHAHKNFLAARSPIFSAMFQHDMTETNLSTVEIPDFEYDVLKEMLRFIYAARVENIEKVACGLLAAADKYQIEGLKDKCEEILSGAIMIDNAIDILIMADRHNVPRLKARAMHFVKVHIKNVMGTNGFKSIEQTHILMDIIEFLTEK